MKIKFTRLLYKEIYIFDVDKNITIGQFVYNILHTEKYKLLKLFFNNLSIEHKNIKTLSLLSKIIKFSNKNIIYMYEESYNNDYIYTQNLQLDINNYYFNSILLYNKKKYDYAFLEFKISMIYYDYLETLNKKKKLIDFKNYINKEDPITFESFDEVQHKIFWVQDNKTFWMNHKNLNQYLKYFTKIDENGVRQIISPFYDIFIEEPWRTEFLSSN